MRACTDTSFGGREWRRTRPRPPRSMRMAGYIIGALVNSAFIWLLNVSPGWRWVPFLSDDFAGVVGVMTLSFALGVVANLVYVALDPPWLRRLGDAVTAAAGLAVLLQLVRIFPFIAPFPWPVGRLLSECFWCSRASVQASASSRTSGCSPATSARRRAGKAAVAIDPLLDHVLLAVQAPLIISGAMSAVGGYRRWRATDSALGWLL